MTTKTEFQSVITEYFISFLQDLAKDEDKIKTSKLVESWVSDENRERFNDMITLRMPEPKKLKARKPKDPNAPKRPKSAFFLFSDERRASVKAEFPDLKMPDVAKKLGQMWKEEKNRTKWENEAKKNKDCYEEEKLRLHPLEDARPKRAKSSYLFFCQEKRPAIREQDSDLKLPDVSRELARLWKEEFPDEKSRKKWSKLAEEDKQRYEIEKKEYEEDHPEQVKAPKSKKGK